MTGYDGRGARFDITVVEGNDLSFTVTAVDSDAAAVDLSAATIVGTIYNGSGTSIDTLTAAVGGAGSNVITLSLTDTEVDALVDPATWALKVTRSGDDRTWLAGRFQVVDPDRARNGTSGTAVTATVDTDAVVTVSLMGLTGPAGATGPAGPDPWNVSTTQSGATYTVDADDADSTIIFSNSSQVTVTLPTDAADDLADGFRCLLFAAGAGGVTLSTAGLTLVGSAPNTNIAQNEGLYVEKTATANTWIVVGGTT